MLTLTAHWFIAKCREYTTIPWGDIDDHWWSFPAELSVLVICFIGFHVASENHLLKSLDSFSRKWNISHQTAQPTIYALGAVAPIIVISNVSFALDVLNQTSHAHRLGVCSILGFGAAAAALIPSSCVQCLVGHIVLPKTTTIRDGIFITILLLMFLIIAVTGKVYWWKAVILGAVYILYLFSIICFPKIKERFLSPNPMETNRLLNQLKDTNIKRDIFNRPIHRCSLLEHTDGYKGGDRDSSLEPTNDSDGNWHCNQSLNGQNGQIEDSCLLGPAQETQILNHSNYTTITTSPDRQSMASRQSAVCLRHPMIMSEFDADYPLNDSYPSDIDEEYQDEPSGSLTKTENAEEDTGSIHKIFLRTPKEQKGTYNIMPAITFESLNQHNFPNLPANTDSVATKSPSRRNSKVMALLKTLYQWLCTVYWVISYPVRLVLKFTIPPCSPHDRCECLYPLTFILSILYLIAFSIPVIQITNHWHSQYSWSLSIMGMVLIGPICTLSNIVDCCTLSLQGYSAEVVANSYHYQISNFWFGIILPLIIASALNAVDPFYLYIEEAIFVYLLVLTVQSMLLLLPLWCGSKTITLTRPKGWVFIFVYIVAIVLFYYFVSH